ncbi:hypothetical protein PROPHIGD43A-4_48 [Mycobacterium phage prophiGD43A-4]|nr:hypothetical protein PROPHIGD43A-4_48 [Mycobacterium phage prophiGD43A-4]WJJ55801.1 hypothetical protein PROPHIT463_50 [Mycobacterium phage prophiT46-3]
MRHKPNHKRPARQTYGLLLRASRAVYDRLSAPNGYGSHAEALATPVDAFDSRRGHLTMSKHKERLGVRYDNDVGSRC